MRFYAISYPQGFVTPRDLESMPIKRAAKSAPLLRVFTDSLARDEWVQQGLAQMHEPGYRMACYRRDLAAFGLSHGLRSPSASAT